MKSKGDDIVQGKKRLIIDAIFSCIVLLGLSAILMGNIKKDDDTISLGENRDYKYCIKSNKDLSQENKYMLNVTTYDKKNENIYDNEVQVSNEDFPINIYQMKSFESKPLILALDMRRILSINFENGQIEELVTNITKEPYKIKNYSIHNNNLIYSYEVLDSTIVEFKNIETGEMKKLSEVTGTIDSISIYENKAAFINKNKIYIYDLKTGKLIKNTESNYDGDILLYGDKIYAFKKLQKGFDFVAINEELEEELILKNCLHSSNVYYYDNMISFEGYFYGIDDKKVYIKNTYSSCENVKDFEKGKDYYEYNLESDIKLSDFISYYKSNTIRHIDEKVIIMDEENKITKQLEGFNYGNEYYFDQHNKVYGVDKIDNKLILTYVDLESGKKVKLKHIESIEAFFSEINCIQR